jgi:hypothetical protein
MASRRMYGKSATPQSVGAFLLIGTGSAAPDRSPRKGIRSTLSRAACQCPPDQCRSVPRNVDHRRDEGERERLRALVKGDAGPERKGPGQPLAIAMASRERARTLERSPRWVGRRGRVRGRRGLQLTKIACSRLVPAGRLSRSGISAKRLPFGLRIQKRARGDSVPTITSPAYLVREAAGTM